MIPVGEIKLILNQEYLLVVTNEHSLKADDVLVVYNELASKQLEDAVGLKSLFIPKGKLVVIAKQAENVYLVSTVKTQEVKRRRFINPQTHSVFSSWANILGKLDVEEEVIESVPLKYPAKIDAKDSLNISFSPLIKVGDKVGIEE